MTVCRFGSEEIEVDMLAETKGKEILHFRHPINGKWYELADIETILSDMKNYFNNKKVEVEKLIKNIRSDNDLENVVIKGVKEKDYSWHF